MDAVTATDSFWIHIVTITLPVGGMIVAAWISSRKSLHEIHISTNGKLEQALARISDLDAQIKKLEE